MTTIDDGDAVTTGTARRDLFQQGNNLVATYSIDGRSLLASLPSLDKPTITSTSSSLRSISLNLLGLVFMIFVINFVL